MFFGYNFANGSNIEKGTGDGWFRFPQETRKARKPSIVAQAELQRQASPTCSELFKSGYSLC